jgi:hypothetical protein
MSKHGIKKKITQLSMHIVLTVDHVKFKIDQSKYLCGKLKVKLVGDD